jgi:hypothetical protein
LTAHTIGFFSRHLCVSAAARREPAEAGRYALLDDTKKVMHGGGHAKSTSVISSLSTVSLSM